MIRKGSVARPLYPAAGERVQWLAPSPTAAGQVRGGHDTRLENGLTRMRRSITMSKDDESKAMPAQDC